jgi:hypothetical protein
MQAVVMAIAFSCRRGAGGRIVVGITECAGTSDHSSISILRSPPKRFELLRSNSSEKSAVLTNRQRPTKRPSWLPSMRSPVSRRDFFNPSKQTPRRRIGKKRPSKRKRVRQKDSVLESAWQARIISPLLVSKLSPNRPAEWFLPD